MSFSNVSGTQRQQQEEGLKKVLALSLLGSTFLHGVALPFSLKLVKPAEFAEDAIEVVMLDEPKVEETKPELAIEEKVSPPPETLKPEPPPEPTPPEEPRVETTPPPIPEEPLKEISPSTPPEPSPPPKQNSNPPDPPKSLLDERETPSPDPRKSEPPVRTLPPKDSKNLRDVTTGNANVSGNPETNNSPSPGPPDPGDPGPGGPAPGDPGPGDPGPGDSSKSTQKQTNQRRQGSPKRRSGPPPGTCISCGEPKYPSAAKKQKREGRVEVIFDIDPDGKPFNIEILTSSNHDDFDQAAKETVKKWKFASLESGIQGKTAWVTFRLKNEGFF